MDVYVVSCDDYFQVSKGQTLKLSYIYLLERILH